MTQTRKISGTCLCGAVTVRAEVEKPNLRACHCDMCRKHTSGMFISIATVPGSVQAEGPVKSFQSSDWAERGFCEACGSTLWYGTIKDGIRHPAAGLFEGAAGGDMKIEFFADECPAGYALAGEHRKMTTEETEALFAPEEE